MERQLNVQGLAQSLTVPIIERDDEAVIFRFSDMPAAPPAAGAAPASTAPSGKGPAAAAE